MNELNKLIKVTTTTNSDGSFNVFIGTGQQLVVGARANELTATAAKADPEKTVVGLKTAGGTQELPESMIVGGELGGLVAFRRDSLEVAANEMGRVAASLALTFNAQHELGQDLLGKATGESGFVGDFFTIPAPNSLRIRAIPFQVQPYSPPGFWTLRRRALRTTAVIFLPNLPIAVIRCSLVLWVAIRLRA